MSPLVALTVFVAIFPAELPDKTFIATLVLSTRYPPLPVWVGAAAAFLVQTAVAVGAGGLISLLPSRPVHAATAALFLVGAVTILLVDSSPAEEAQEVEAELADLPRGPSPRRVALTSFGILFAAEWGDLSQLLTAAFAARYSDPVGVGVGALAALWIVSGLGALGGRALLRVVPVVWVRRLAAAIFLALAAATAVSAARG